MAETSDVSTSRWDRYRNVFEVSNKFKDNLTPNSGVEHSDRIPRAEQPVKVRPQASRPNTVVPTRLQTQTQTQTQYGNYGAQQGGGRLSHQQGPHFPSSSFPPPNNEYHHPHTQTGSTGQSQYGASNQYHQNQGYPNQQQYIHQHPHQNNPNMYSGYTQSAQSSGPQYADESYIHGSRLEDQRPSYEASGQQSNGQWLYGGNHSSPTSYAPAEPFSPPASVSPPAASGYPGRSAMAHSYPYQGTPDSDSRHAHTRQFDPGERDDITHSRGAQQARQLSQPQPQQGYDYGAQPNYYQNNSGHEYR